MHRGASFGHFAKTSHSLTLRCNFDEEKSWRRGLSYFAKRLGAILKKALQVKPIQLHSGNPLLRLFHICSLTKAVFNVLHQRFIFIVLHTVVLEEGGHSSRWSLIMWSPVTVVSYHGGLSSVWSLIAVVSHQSGLLSRWNLIKVVCLTVITVLPHRGGLSPWLSPITVVCHHRCLSLRWSVIRWSLITVVSPWLSLITVVSHHGSLFPWLSLITVVSYYSCL